MLALEHLWQRIKSFFSDDEDELLLEDKLELLGMGDIVRLKFRDPTKLGFLDPASAWSSRFEPEDYKTRILQGQITQICDLSDELWYFELQVVKPSGMIRKYVFLEDEIEELDFLDGKYGER